MGQLASGYGIGEGIQGWLAEQRARALEERDRQQRMVQQERENYLRMQQEDRNRQIFERQKATLDAAPAQQQAMEIEIEKLISTLPPETQIPIRLQLKGVTGVKPDDALSFEEKQARAEAARTAGLKDFSDRAEITASTNAKYRAEPRDEQYKDVPRRIDRVDDDPDSPTYGENIVEFIPESQLGGRTFRQSLPQGIRSRVADLDVADQSFSTIEHLFKPEWVGPVAGRLGMLGQKIPGVPVDEFQAEFYAQLTAIRNATIKAITGAQMSEPEAKRIKDQIPSAEDKPEVFLAKMRATKQNQAVLRSKLSMPGSDRSRETGGGGTVKMQAPNGQTKDVPADQVPFYEARGAKVVQ